MLRGFPKSFLVLVALLWWKAPISVFAESLKAVQTFESVGLYWSPAAGSEKLVCDVKYREEGASLWKEGLPLWFDSRNAEYRGSVVHLKPGTGYQLKLSLDQAGMETSLIVKTWSEHQPVSKTITLPVLSSKTLIVNESGSPQGYVLYAAPPNFTAAIDVQKREKNNILIQASYVIIRGLALRGANKHAIELGPGSHDVIIENNDISDWGSLDEADGYARDYDAAIRADDKGTERIIIQRNKIHHPSYGSNSWLQERKAKKDSHPGGAHAIFFTNTAGNHVIRYNDIYSGEGLYFNDAIGGAENYSDRGFPNRDSDIYGNRISHAWDDGIESEGANMNVRIWGNYIDKTFVKIAIAATSKGPLYIWRNVGGVALQDDTGGNTDNTPHGPFIKAGGRVINNVFCGGGRTYIFHNTMLQPASELSGRLPIGGSAGIADSGGTIKNIVSRNNIFQAFSSGWSSISDKKGDSSSDYDFDLFNGVISTGVQQERHGIKGIPQYVTEAGSEQHPLRPSSLGFDAGIRIPNFNDEYKGKAPDIGAFESGEAPIEFGKKAYIKQCGWRCLK